MKTGHLSRAQLFPILIPAISIASALTVALAVGPAPPPAGITRGADDHQKAATIALPTSRGRSMFVQSCAHCHGDDARGSGEDSDGPDLHGLRFSNARIATIIHQGIRGEMPSFARKYSASETADLIAYLRTLH